MTVHVLTNTNSSKLRWNQGAGTELAIGGNWGPVEEPIGTSRLERGRGRGRRRGAGADGWLRGKKMVNVTAETIVSKAHQLKIYLDYSRVLREGACWFGRLTHSQVLDVTASEDDVLEGVISRRDGSVSGAVLSAKGTNWGKRLWFSSCIICIRLKYLVLIYKDESLRYNMWDSISYVSHVMGILVNFHRIFGFNIWTSSSSLFIRK